MKKPTKNIYSKSKKLANGGDIFHDLTLGFVDQNPLGLGVGAITGKSASQAFGLDYDTQAGKSYQNTMNNVAGVAKQYAPVAAGLTASIVGGPAFAAPASAAVKGAQGLYQNTQTNNNPYTQSYLPQTNYKQQQLTQMALGGIVGSNRVVSNPSYHISDKNHINSFNIGGYLPKTNQIGANISNTNQVTGQNVYHGQTSDNPYKPEQYEEYFGKGGGIHIKPENKGKFNAYKQRTGKTTEEALHSSNTHVRQMANFAKNASHWNHAFGGTINQKGGMMANGGNIYNQPYLGTTDLTYAQGGNMEEDYIQMNGDKHSEPSDGIDYTPGVKVEGKEGIWKKPDGSKYVFSEQLGFAKKFDKFKNKYSLRTNDKLSTDMLNRKLGELEQEQEIYKATEGIKNKYKQMAKGGYIKMEGGGGFSPDLGDDVSGSATELLDNNQTQGYNNPNIVEDNSNIQWNNNTQLGGLPTIANSSNGSNNYNKYFPYAGAAAQSIGDLAYYGKGYNKLRTTNYQAPQFQSYNPATLNPNQALREAELGTRTALNQVPNYSGGNSATALSNMIATQATGNRNKADIRNQYDNANIGIRNQANQYNTQGQNQFNLNNAGMNYQSSLGNLQDLSQMQNVDIGHLSNLGAYGAQGIQDQLGYNTQQTNLNRLGSAYNNYTYDANGNIVYRRKNN